MGISRLPAIFFFLVLVVIGLVLGLGPGNHASPPEIALVEGVNASPVANLNAMRGTVIVAAGDIACAPEDPGFNGGLGTDSRCQMAATAELVKAQNPDLVLPLGDNQYERGELVNYQASYEPTWGQFKAISRPVPGNHEYYGQEKQAQDYFQYFGALAGDFPGGYYSYDLGNWHLVALNSNCEYIGGCAMGSPQQRWLAEDLANNDKTCTLAYWHHPRYSSGVHGNNRQMTDLWQTLYDGGAELVLSGHDHLYERFAPQTAQGDLDQARGLRQFVVGAGGKSLYPFRTIRPHSEARAAGVYGVLAMDLRSNGYTWRYLPTREGEFTDQGQALCH